MPATINVSLDVLMQQKGFININDEQLITSKCTLNDSSTPYICWLRQDNLPKSLFPSFPTIKGQESSRLYTFCF
jgi:hypothetical protein